MRQKDTSRKSNASKREKEGKKEPRDNRTRKNGKRTRTKNFLSLFFPLEERAREKRSEKSDGEVRGTK